MARRNATTTVGYADENSRPINQPSKLAVNAQRTSVPAIPKRQALGCIQTNRVAEKKPLAKRDCGNQVWLTYRRGGCGGLEFCYHCLLLHMR